MIFQKLHLLFLVGADILGDWQGGGYDSGYTQGRIQNGKMSPLFRGEYDAVSGAADRIGLPSTC
jgi:molybdopterin-containing oxidoreductase family iron-sulfur binding subunit